MPGRRPDPLRQLTGSGHREIPVPATIDPGLPEVPTSISEYTAGLTDAESGGNHALEMWEYLTGALSVAGILESTDRYALELACLTYAQFRRAQLAYEVEPIVAGSQGQVKRSPWFDIMQASRVELRRQLVEFGLTPAARVKIGVLQAGGVGLKGALDSVLSGTPQKPTLVKGNTTGA